VGPVALFKVFPPFYWVSELEKGEKRKKKKRKERDSGALAKAPIIY